MVHLKPTNIIQNAVFYLPFPYIDKCLCQIQTWTSLSWQMNLHTVSSADTGHLDLHRNAQTQDYNFPTSYSELLLSVSFYLSRCYLSKCQKYI